VSRDTVKTQAALLAAIDTAPKGTHVPRGELTAIPHTFTPDSNWVFIDERKAKEIQMVPSRGHRVRLAIAHESASWLEVTAVSTDGAWLAGGYEDGTLAVWRTKTGKLVARFRDPEKPAQLAVDQLSRRLVSVTAAGVARVYEMGGR
jgi:WD40 repeat protein